MKPGTEATLRELAAFLHGQGQAVRNQAGVLRERGVDDVSDYEHDAARWEQFAAAVDDALAEGKP